MEEQAAAPPKKSWFRRHKIWTTLGGLFLLFTIGSAMAHPTTPPSKAATVQTQQSKQETNTVTEKQAVAFETQQVDDATLSKGTTKVTQQGKNGEKTIVYQVVSQNGKEVSRKEISETISLVPVPQIVANGTKVAAATTPPAAVSQSTTTTTSSGVTAVCKDGTPSYSAHASGTCSHHGGVAQWINHP